MDEEKEEEWLKNKPLLAPKWLAKLIWFWVLKNEKDYDLTVSVEDTVNEYLGSH